MKYSSDQFRPNEAWMIFRIQSFLQIKGKPADVYLLIDLASAYVFGHIIVMGELPDLMEVYRLMRDAYAIDNVWPEFLYCDPTDIAVDVFRKFSAGKNISLKTEPLSSFKEIITPIEDSFNNFQRSGTIEETLISDEEREEVRAFIPDSYDLCPCASGLKYKFCCKPIFNEVIEAMVHAEEGRLQEALSWMDKAKKKIGETAEILCRYAIVYSSFDKVKADEFLEACLKSYPNHPRANYIKGINSKNSGYYEDAVKSYSIAISNYPPTDRFHLNEVWNNLGSAYFEMKKYAEAKSAWEKALEYLPRDKMALKNLGCMIYENPNVPDDLK